MIATEASGARLSDVLAGRRLGPPYEGLIVDRDFPPHGVVKTPCGALDFTPRPAPPPPQVAGPLPPPPPPPPPDGALLTSSLGKVVGRVLRRRPADFSPQTMAIAADTAYLRTLCPLGDDELFVDKELGPAFVLGRAEPYETVEISPSDNTVYHPRQPSDFGQQIRLVVSRDGWRPRPWYLPSDVAALTKDYAAGQRALKAILNPSSLSERLERLEARL